MLLVRSERKTQLSNFRWRKQSGPVVVSSGWGPIMSQGMYESLAGAEIMYPPSEVTHGLVHIASQDTVCISFSRYNRKIACTTAQV